MFSGKTIRSEFLCLRLKRRKILSLHSWENNFSILLLTISKTLITNSKPRVNTLSMEFTKTWNYKSSSKQVKPMILQQPIMLPFQSCFPWTSLTQLLLSLKILRSRNFQTTIGSKMQMIKLLMKQLSKSLWKS